MFLIFIFVFLLGLVIGSFLNVVILRINTGVGIGGRSTCFSCGKKLKWFELIPLMSFLFLRGRCRTCRGKISWQYPIVEFATASLFLFFFLRDFSLGGMTFLSVVISWIIWAVLIVIFVYDIRHKIIPDSFVFVFIFLGFIHAVLGCNANHCDLAFPFGSLLAGVALFLFFFLLWLVSKGKWIGFGDAKLALGMGFYLGIAKGLSALALSFWIGAGVAVSLLVLQKVYSHLSPRLSSSSKMLTMKSAIPFAPFLILATFIAEILNSDIFGIHRIFF